MSKPTNQRMLTKSETSNRRSLMDVTCFELKIQTNKLSNSKLVLLNSFFSQAKWLSNAIISSQDLFKYDYKSKSVYVKWFEDDIEHNDIRELTLPSQIKQEIKTKIIGDIVTLAKKKKKGSKIGRLKFRKEVNTIQLKQYKVTWNFGPNETIRVAKLGDLKVHGLDQLTKDIKEYGCAKLIRKPSGFYIHITCFKDKTNITKCPEVNKVVGLDFGIKDNITLSTGEKFNCKIKVPRSIKRLQRRKAKGVKRSHNTFKLQKKINKHYESISNKKKDLTNKFINSLETRFNTIVYQDENLKGWHSGWFGRQVQESCLGRIKSKLNKLNTSKGIMINRFEPSTKVCPICGVINNIGLEERVYKCCCGLEEDRDIKSAKTIALMGINNYSNIIPMEYRDFKPVEKLTSGFSEVLRTKSGSMNQEAAIFRWQ